MAIPSWVPVENGINVNDKSNNSSSDNKGEAARLEPHVSGGSRGQPTPLRAAPREATLISRLQAQLIHRQSASLSVLSSIFR